MKTFGPVPSRRLGMSLGINNIPPKNCSYSCVYCQLGKTKNIRIKRCEFYKSDEIIDNVKSHIDKALKREITIDYLTFVADGEPTLDKNLGHEIDGLKGFGHKIAVITNSSIVNHKSVQKDLMKADCVSLKIDSLNEDKWKKINRPHDSLNFNDILSGIQEFADNYKGRLITETMLIKTINDGKKDYEEIAGFLGRIKPSCAYISMPIRPPAEKWILPPDKYSINKAFEYFNRGVENVKFLIDYEGNQFGYTGSVEDNLLSIMSVHPMREDSVNLFLAEAKSSHSVIDKLIKQNKIVKTKYKGKFFFRRNLNKN